MDLRAILYNLPEVKKPTEKKLDFNTKLKWTLIILGAFFILANIPLYGLSSNFFERFGSNLAVLLGTEFGSIIHLGIGPIVMSSIILQLLVGSGILAIDTKTPQGKQQFQGLQRLGVLFFILFEAVIFVFTGALQPIPGFTGLLILQLILGGLLIMYMDEVTQKWGFGSGVSLFIVAGVSWQLVTGLLQFSNPVTGANCLLDFTGTPCGGDLLIVLQSIVTGIGTEFQVSLAAILVTILIFLGVVWAQNLKVEVPLSYERVRGYSMKWPLNFFYASVIPVILVAALAANVQLFGGIIQNWLGRPTFLGNFSNGVPIGGLAYWLSSSNIIEPIIRGSFQPILLLQALTYLIFFAVFSAVFAVFWVKTAGMDESSQAKNIVSYGLQLPGFRKDPRVLESILKRYIMPLTVMGGLAIGILAAVADFLGAITSGTAILLAVMIVYQLYQNIAQQHAVDMTPGAKKFFGG